MKKFRNDLLSVQDAAKAMGLHYVNLYKYLRFGAIPGLRQNGKWKITSDTVRRYHEGEFDVSGVFAKRGDSEALEIEARSKADGLKRYQDWLKDYDANSTRE